MLRTEERLLGGSLPGHLRCVLGCKAWLTPGAMGGSDGDGASRGEARGLGAVVRYLQHFRGLGRGWRSLAVCW